MTDFLPLPSGSSVVSDAAAGFLIDKNNEEKTNNIGNMFHETNTVWLEVAIRQLAKEASLRYEYFLANMLSTNASQDAIDYTQITKCLLLT